MVCKSPNPIPYHITQCRGTNRVHAVSCGGGLGKICTFILVATYPSVGIIGSKSDGLHGVRLGWYTAAVKIRSLLPPALSSLHSDPPLIHTICSITTFPAPAWAGWAVGASTGPLAICACSLAALKWVAFCSTASALNSGESGGWLLALGLAFAQ